MKDPMNDESNTVRNYIKAKLREMWFYTAHDKETSNALESQCLLNDDDDCAK